MNSTVAAALKKIAVALFSDTKILKKVAVFILSLLVGLLMPMAAVLGIFTGKIEINKDDIENAMDSDKVAYYQRMDNTYQSIDAEMTNAGYGTRKEEAQVLFVMYLTDFMDQEDFVLKLVGCFSQGQTDAELVAKVNEVFGTEIQLEDYSKVIEVMRMTTINPYIFKDPLTKNNVDLVAFAYEACEDHWGYVWATYGELLSDKKLNELAESFPTEVGEKKDFIQKNWLGRRTSDCAGLIKAYLWYDTESGEIIYENYGFEDLRANELYDAAAEKGTLDTIPETPGLGVWHDGHAGIYVGNGYVIHANGTHRGVELQLLSDTKFTHWFEIPWIQYVDEGSDGEPVETSELVDSSNQTTSETTPIL